MMTDKELQELDKVFSLCQLDWMNSTLGKFDGFPYQKVYDWIEKKKKEWQDNIIESAGEVVGEILDGIKGN